jgi:hypothetical protein
VREREGDRAAVRSSSIRVREGDGRRCAERRQLTGRAAAARAGGGRRPGSLTGWAHLSVSGGDGPTGPKREGGGGPWLGWKRRVEAGPKLLLGLKSKRVKRKINFN